MENIIEEDGLYDVYFSRSDCSAADVLIMYGVEIHAGEDAEQVCNDWPVDDVKRPSVWDIHKIEKQKQGRLA